MADETYILLQLIVNIITLIMLSIISTIYIIRIIKEKRESDSLNVTRALILGIFISFIWSILWEFIYVTTSIRENLSYEQVLARNTFSIYNIGVAMMINFGLMTLFYYNEWKKLYVIPILIFFILFIIFLITGIGIILIFYIYGGGLLVLVLMTYYSFKLKDNKLLGLCIFFILAFISNILMGTYIGQIVKLSYSIFGLFFAFELFHPFKEEKI